MDESRIPEKLRWKIIYPLAKVFPKWCWSYLVMWAAYGYRDRLTDARVEYRQCQNGPDTQREGSCYCGKYKVE